MKKRYRQGDVLLTKIDSIPASCKKDDKKGPAILAYGEVTGHHHSVQKGGVIYTDPETNVSYLEIAEALALLEHQEHAAIPLEKGFYEITFQREYHPEEIRRVVD